MIHYKIPDSEFIQRVKHLQSIMAKEGLDLLLAYGNETEPQFVRYLSDYWPSFETASVLLATKGYPLLLIGPESLAYASDRSRISEIRLLKAFRESSEPEYPGKPLDTFQTVINEVMGGEKLQKIGIAGLSLMTVGVYHELVESLNEYGHVEIVKADSLVNGLRMIKSSNELDCMRAAALVTKNTFDYVLQHVHSGMTENQVIGLALGKIHELGAERESYPMWALTGTGSDQAISRARSKVIEPGDMMQLQIGARVAGYASSIGRPIIFGKAKPWQRDLIKAGYIGYKTVVSKLKAGIQACEIALIYEQAIRKIGYGNFLLYGPCHGNGLMEGEPPWIETNSKWMLKENMTFCIDIYLGDSQKQIGLRIEDVVRITNEGIEQLTNYPQELFEIPK